MIKEVEVEALYRNWDSPDYDPRYRRDNIKISIANGYDKSVRLVGTTEDIDIIIDISDITDIISMFTDILLEK